MVRLSPEGIVNFSQILSDPFRVMIINNWMMLIAGSYYTLLRNNGDGLISLCGS